MNLMTIMYMCIQETLNDPDGMAMVCEKLRECDIAEILLGC